MWNLSIVNPVTLADGYGLNLAPEAMTEAAEPYRIYPATPDNVWAGDEPTYQTVFLKFPDEATARAALPALWIEA